MNGEYSEEYAKGYNYAKREISLSGEYERAWARGFEDAKKVLHEHLDAGYWTGNQLAELIDNMTSRVYKEGYCNWCADIESRDLRIEYYWIDSEGHTASYTGKDGRMVATGIARYCPCCGRKIKESKGSNDASSS